MRRDTLTLWDGPPGTGPIWYVFEPVFSFTTKVPTYFCLSFESASE